MGRFATITDTVPEPCRVAGTRLKSFCLGHHLLFSRLGLPFAIDPLAEASRENIASGIAICAGESYESTLGQMLSGDWVKAFDEWVSHTARLKVDWTEAEETFRAYLTDGYRKPPTYTHGGPGGISFSAPWELILKIRLMLSGFRESDVLNGYLPGRWYDYFAIQEQRQLDQIHRIAAAGAKNPESYWKKVFVTRGDDERLQAVQQAQEATKE